MNGSNGIQIENDIAKKDSVYLNYSLILYDGNSSLKSKPILQNGLGKIDIETNQIETWLYLNCYCRMDWHLE